MGDSTVCKLYKKVAFSHTGPKEAIFTRLRCKQWSCDFCAKKNASIWRAFLVEKLPTIGSEWFLMTLTANSQTRSHEGSMANIRANFDALIKRMKRVFGKVSYVRTYEKHPSSDAVHLHAIVCGVTPYVALGHSSKMRPMAIGVLSRGKRNGSWSLKTWVKKNTQELGMGYIADIRKIEGEITRAIWYVTKYLTKAMQDIRIKGLRHVQTTRDIGSPKNENSQTWYTAPYITANMFQPNAKITDLNTGKEIGNNYWEEHSFYPFED